MRPAEDVRVWRKNLRAAMKGARRGRRSTHQTYITGPLRGSTWTRRHPGQFDYYRQFAGQRRIPADLRGDS